MVPLAFVAVVLLAAVSAWLSPRPAPGSDVNRGTRFFLALLGLAIGWHFFFEGLAKLTDASWSSEGYLREAVGPLAPFFRALAGDRLKDELQVVTPGELPPRLALEWQTYLQWFLRNYDLSEKQQEEARAKFEQVKEKALHVLTREQQPVHVPAALPPVLEGLLTVPQRLQLYEEKLALAARAEAEEVPIYGAAGWARVRDYRSQAQALRQGLKRDLERLRQELRTALASVLAPEQQSAVPLPSARLPLRALFSWSWLDWVDVLVPWGLCLVGGLLLLGLGTRTASLAAAGFLLLFYLAMPPLPGLPENPRAEGHYLYINKNVIELLACLALATTRRGRWLGLEGLFRLWRRRSEASASAVPPAASDTPPTASVPSVQTNPKESTHGP